MEPINEGLSSDQKYIVHTREGRRLLLRVADVSQYERKKSIFDRMEHVASLGIPMSCPVDFGLCNDGKSVYQLLTWCDGENLEPLLPTLPKEEQYAHGLRAGEILRVIHEVSAPDTLEDWEVRYCGVMEGRVKAFVDCGLQIQGSEAMFRYYEDNKRLLIGRPQCFHHGDYHVGNLLLSHAGTLSVIDWELLDYDNYGDPWEEFNRIGCSEVAPYFTTGLIRGYFAGEPPSEFWSILALYLCAGALSLVSWAFYIQRDQLDYAIGNAHAVLRYFDNMNNLLPTWYLKENELA